MSKIIKMSKIIDSVVILILLIFLLFHAPLIAQEKKALPNQITLWNPYDLQFTPDNKYLVVSSPNDSKIWNIQNLEVINLPTNFFKDVNATNNAWAYLSDQNAFYFHQCYLDDRIYKEIADSNQVDFTQTLGKGKYDGYNFCCPPSYFLTSDILLLCSKATKIFIICFHFVRPLNLIMQKQS